ncbi:uracil-xanthine permease family protein [Clostridium cylindrosporum]|uniref:Uric acid permease PucK n=1 Tax=Clostridium cylindrosporum DSM 605 TaxID=1121307 RepID=A0A0J8D7Y8_CLOCY|nr:solute carrier family 23 protein [Clostridium cylindrosporum]KMT22160.1 uric acid permease PucK [Clostridium cylindrosporum DSM 605]
MIDNVVKEAQVTSSPFEEKVPPREKIILALQQVLTLCPGSITVALVVGRAMKADPETLAFLVASTLFANAIAALIQVYGIGKFIGSKAPLALGASFVPLAPMIIVGTKHGFPALFGAIMVSSVVVFVLCFFMHKILVFFPPIVMGSFVTLLGISLAPVAFGELAGAHGSPTYGSAKNLILGFVVIAIVIAFERFGKGIVKSIALMLGLVIGTIIGAFMGMIDFTPLMEAKWFQIVTPFKFGVPQFNTEAIVIMTIFCIINLVQCIGVFAILDDLSGQTTNNKGKSKGLRGQAVAQLLAGAFNAFPQAFLSENVAIFRFSKYKSNSIIRTAAVMLIIIAFIPKLTTLITLIPTPVLGGVTVCLFGIITTSGMSILRNVNLSDNKNFIILAISMSLGIGAHYAGKEAFVGLTGIWGQLLSNGLFMVSVSSILLYTLFNFGEIKTKLKES